MVWFGVDAEDNHSLIMERSNSSSHQSHHKSDRELSISTSRHGKLINLLDNNYWLPDCGVSFLFIPKGKQKDNIYKLHTLLYICRNSGV